MRRFLKLIIILALFGGIFIVGYFAGNKVGRMYGAQQYTKKLWGNGEMQLSENKILEKINEYRKDNNLASFKEAIGLCRLARYRAEETTESYGGKWAVETQQYEGVISLHESKLTAEKAKELCPECILETLGENAYISVRPEPCLNLAGKKVCVGGEEFGVVENYTDRVVNGWIDSPEHNELLLSPVEFGCVGAYGGTVMLEVAQIE